MSGYRIGNGYYGANAILVSQVDDELVQSHKPLNFTMPLEAYKFTFIPIGDNCLVEVNGEEILMLADKPWSIDYIDKPITSFVLLTDAIDYWYCFAW